MTNGLMREYLEKVRLRYLKGSKKHKTLILDEFCEVFEVTRKHAIKIFNNELSLKAQRAGPKLRYGPEVKEHILILWEAMNKMCSKKMVAGMALWLNYYDGISLETRMLLLRISSSSIDRILSKHKAESRRGMSTTEPSLIKNKIPIKLLDQDVIEPGYIEADTVVHCGNSLAGEFINTLTMTDLYSSWTENRAVWKKESQTIMNAISSIENNLPFDVKGFASDNGNEFLNHDLHSYFFNRKNRVEFVRRRPYQKNDNAHVEQKNWTHVREIFGYDRFDDLSQVEWMNDIYQRLWNPIWNFFTPVMKLKTKTRIGGKITKIYDTPTTPYHRLMISQTLTPEQKQKLEDKFKELNPFILKKELDEKLKWFFKLAEIRKKSMSEAG